MFSGSGNGWKQGAVRRGAAPPGSLWAGVRAYRMHAHRGLLIGARQAAVYEWRDKLAVLRAQFAVGEEGRQGFRRYLAETPDAPFYLLVDVADEEYRQDTVPRVSRRDRQALLERKAARQFKDSAYWFYRITGRETTGRDTRGRGHERVLLSALANPAVVRQWVALLDETRTPVAAICSLPLFSQQLLKDIAAPDNGFHDGLHLLISVQSVSGLRQTCFENGEFRFSRLMQMPPDEHGLSPEIIREEVEKVLRYLNGQRSDAPVERLHVHFLHGADLAEDLTEDLQSAFSGRDKIRCHFRGLRDLLGGPVPEELVSTPFCDVYFMQKLLRTRPGNHYAGAVERRWFFLRRLRAGVAGAGMALLLGSALWGTTTIYRGIVFYRAGYADAEQARRYTAEYELARNRLPETPVDPQHLKAAVVFADSLAQYGRSPIGTVSVLSRALDGFPSIRLDGLSWMLADEPATAFAGGPNHAGVTAATVKSGAPDRADVTATTAESGAPDRTDLTAATAASGAARSLYQVAVVKARIEPFGGNVREAMETVKRFAEDLLGREAVYDVVILALPLDISSDADLQGNTQSVRQRAEFTLKLVLENVRKT